MRVLVVANNFPTPRAAHDGVYVLRQLQALRSLGHDFEVMRCAPLAPWWLRRWKYYRSFPSEYTVDGFPVQIVRTLSAPREMLLPTYGLQAAGRLKSIVRRFRPDLLHAQGTLPSGLVSVFGGLPVVLTGHGTDTYDMPWRRRSMERSARKAVAGASAVTAVSKFVAGHLQRLGARNVTVIPNGADEQTFAPSERTRARSELGLPREQPVVAFAGRIEAAKGVFDLLEAGAAMVPRPLLFLCGEGKDRSRIAELARARSLDVRLPGALSQPEVAKAFAAADVVALPSYREGLPAVLCEAMLAGRAVVASSAGGIPEIVRDGETGLLHEPGNVEQLRAALTRILAHPEMRAQFEEAARADSLTRLTWSANARRYDEIYRNAQAQPV